MKVIIGADHAGFALKEKLKTFLVAQGFEVQDEGAHEYIATDDYPDSAVAVARAVVAANSAEPNSARGVLVCGSGVGASVAANKIAGARACLCHDIYSASQGVEHDDMNIICLGGIIVGEALAQKLLLGFLAAEFINDGRYLRRLKMVEALETA